MNMSRIAVIAALAAMLWMPVAYAHSATDRGKVVSENEAGVCYERDVEDDRASVKKAEALEQAGKLKEAFAAAEKGAPFGCWRDASERMAGIIERTYKKAGKEAEKAGRLQDAFHYYIYPFDRYIAPGYLRDRFEKNFSFADANRVMLAYARSRPDDISVMEEATRYFDGYKQKGAPLNEVLALVRRGGDKTLEKEQKAFAARHYKPAVQALEESERWYRLIDDAKPVNARAKKRVDALLAEHVYDAIEAAFKYTNATLLGENYAKSYAAARARADQLGIEAERKGNSDLAEKFYTLAGDDVRHDALMERAEKAQAHKEKKKEEAEVKRQKKFKDEQKSLEDELGM